MARSEQENTFEVAETGVSTIRPLYFVVVFWGKTFRDYLVEYCLPSLLAPGNLPALALGAHKFVFCTTHQDWVLLSATKMFAVLKQHIEPCFIEIPPAPPGKSGCEHMGMGHKLAAEMAHKDRAYGVFLTPDLMVSDGTVAALCRHALAGARVVLVAALRFGEEPLFHQLTKAGLLNNGVPRSPVVDRIHKSGECLCGAYASEGEIEELSFWYPEYAAYIKGLPAAKERPWGWGCDPRFKTSKKRKAPGPLCQGCGGK